MHVKDLKFVVVIAALALGAFSIARAADTSAEQRAAQPAASPVPLPTTMSPEATRALQALYAADVKATKAPDPTDRAAWRHLQDQAAANNPRAKAAQAVLPELGVSAIDARLGGVPVIDVRPRGWDMADRRLVI
jgi:hypothetical protein